MRIALSAMGCAHSGISESFVAYNWLHQIARSHTVDLITADTRAPVMDNVTVHRVDNDWWPLGFVSDHIRGAVKPQYFVFDRRSGKQCADVVKKCDVFHHVVPQAPRYPSSLGRKARRFVLGPIGGGLRVPESFRSLVEKSEPLISRLRNLDALRFRFDPWLRKTYEAADIILLTAPYMLDILPSRFHGKVEYIAETGIDTESYDGESSPRQEREAAAVLYVGRLTPYKGLEFLLRAVARLPDDIKRKTRVHVVGAGAASYEGRCRNIVSELRIANEVTFHGRLSKPEVREHYRQADIFCFPTLAETTGNVLLEAMAMGLPIVSTDYGGPAAVVDRKAGILIKPDSPEDFTAGITNALQNLILDRQRRRAMGEQARRHVFSTLSWKAKGQQIADVYRRVVGAVDR